METIDLTPTWGEIGLLYVRLAESGETKALTEMRGGVARAFAASQALTAIMGDLPAELRDRTRIIIGEELAKQGFPRSEEQRVGKGCGSTCRFRWAADY